MVRVNFAIIGPAKKNVDSIKCHTWLNHAMLLKLR